MEEFIIDKLEYSVVFNIATNLMSGEKLIEYIARYKDRDDITRWDYVDFLQNGNVTSSSDILIFNPNPAQRKTNIEINPLAVPPVGNYVIPVNAITRATSIMKNITVFLTVINDGAGGTEPEDNNPENWTYNVKYWFENTNVEGNVNWLGIYQKDYTGLPIEIRGNAEFSYTERKDIYEPFVSSNLSLLLEANTSLSLQDLYSEEEMTYKVIWKLNNEVKFIGWIKPDGIFEDMTTSDWNLDVDAFDGLSTLKDLSFNRYDGLEFPEKKLSILKVIENCLKRTGLFLPINVSVGLAYSLSLPENTVLEKTIVSLERYYQERKKPMDCASVIKSLLQVFNATLVQQNGEWWIFRAVDMKPSMTFKKYVSGVATSDVTISTLHYVGSHINGAVLHHISKNQKKTIFSSVQAHRIKYQYGNAKTLVVNPELQMGVGLNCEGWTINNLGGQVRRNDNGLGFYADGTNSLVGVILTQSQTVLAKKNDKLRIFTDFYSYLQRGAIGGNIMRVFWYITTNNYRFTEAGTWKLLSEGGDDMAARFSIANQTVDSGQTMEINTTNMPEDSPIMVSIYIGVDAESDSNHRYWKIGFNRIEITPSQSNIKGLIYTAQRSKRISTVTKEDKTVFNGDSLSDLFVGTLYQEDGETPTSIWHRSGVTEERGILEINAIDNLRIAPRPMQVFEGDVYGFVPYLSVLNFDLATGNYLPTKYTYNFAKNTLKLSSREFSSDHLPNDAYRPNPNPPYGIVEIETDYGNETKVVIR